MNAPAADRPGRFSRGLTRINLAAAAVAAAMIFVMMAVIAYAVAVRFLWNRPIAWVVEASSYLLLYITFLGTAWLLEQDGHVDVDLVTGALAPRRRALAKAATSACGAVVCLLLAWKGAAVTLDYFSRGVTAIGILNVPQYLLMGVIPFGAALLFLQFALKTLRFARRAFAGRAPEGPA
jgi:TRAP-type C4-dicarboxylate transport system permease small subunit